MTPEQRAVEIAKRYPLDSIDTRALKIDITDAIRAAVEEAVEACAAVCERAAERLRREPEAWSGQNAELLQYAAAAIRREVGSTGDTQ